MTKNKKIRDATHRWALMTAGDPADTSLERALRLRYQTAQFSTGRIAEEITQTTGVRVDTGTVRYWLGKFHIEHQQAAHARGKVYDAVRMRGYRTIEDYFLQNPTKTLVNMAAELQVSLSSIQRYYRELVDRVEGAKS